MSDGTFQSNVWGMRAIFFALIAIILFFQLLPLYTAPRGWTGPDLVMAFAFAWAVRRPDYVPSGLLALLFLLTDLLLQRPPGLWAAMMLVACESLKSQARTLRDAGYFTEFFSVAVMIIGVALAYQVVLALFLVGSPIWSLTIIQTLMTLVAYPVAAMFSQTALGVYRIAPGDLDRTLGGS